MEHVSDQTELIINGEEWHLFVSRSMSFWHHVLSEYGHYHLVKDWGMKVPLRLLFLTEHGTLTHVFKTKENALAVDADVLEAFSSKQKIAQLKKKYKQFALELIRSLNNCKKKFSSQNWQRFSDYYERFTHGLALTATMGRVGMEKLSQMLVEQGIPSEQIPETVSIITYPRTHTPLFDSSKDLFLIGSRIQTGKLSKLQQTIALQKWLKKHGYIPVNFCDEPWTLEDAQNQLEGLLKKNCADELKALNQSHKRRIQAAQKTLKKINDPAVSLLAFALQEATYLNEFRKNVFSKVSLQMRPLFEKIAQKAGMSSWRDCYYLLPEEMIQILTGKRIDFDSIKQKRSVIGMYTTLSGELVLLDEPDTQRVLAFLRGRETKQAVSQEQIIKGFSASRGVVHGIVKIILSSKDFAKLQPGEILVTTMTSVDFVPIMQKAAAFVTNEGGITSHASIVAREMNKPCIIGTRNATHVLKDGDEVEVNANTGVVRLLSKNRGSNTRVMSMP